MARGTEFTLVAPGCVTMIDAWPRHEQGSEGTRHDSIRSRRHDMMQLGTLAWSAREGKQEVSTKMLGERVLVFPGNIWKVRHGEKTGGEKAERGNEGTLTVGGGGRFRGTKKRRGRREKSPPYPPHHSLTAPLRPLFHVTRNVVRELKPTTGDYSSTTVGLPFLCCQIVTPRIQKGNFKLRKTTLKNRKKKRNDTCRHAVPAPQKVEQD